ncbi:uncharacterized protein MELLADRAFT_78495 [Melampsora larici-populina 98AG31]|uniref:Ubiquitin carboxyl-terminal hydrolase n=1 Tax=Melampsora larici-populina (strain 98AG31 / pathotype 3-4-7) TaxID=747676 RepID=F4RV11_MELLP|nr:uncharacterized protein MELLADRAFT_78495 [Melampsora larici-populina 98AG31]EGG03793.1 hypothetical protein MELLADRAFT_78495 [Melampsora larici-populina 98AG31]
MAAVASLPPSHFPRTLSQPRALHSSNVDERTDLGEGTSFNQKSLNAVTLLSNGFPSALLPTEEIPGDDQIDVNSNHTSTREQLLQPRNSAHASLKSRGQLWRDALKTPIEFTAGRRLTTGNEIPYEPINRPILPGQGRGVLITAIGPPTSEDDEDEGPSDTPPLAKSLPSASSQHPAASASSDPSASTAPAKSSSKLRGQLGSVSKASLSVTKPIATIWPKLQRMGPGFRNAGNTCFLNATLQALVYTPALAVGLLDRQEHTRDSCRLSHIKNFCALCSMRNLISMCLEPNKTARVIEPTPITNSLTKIAPRMRGGRQEDAHEFLRLLIEAMQNGALGGQEAQAKQKDKEATFIHRMFAGKFRSRVTCQHCEGTSDTFDTFLDLSLDIGEANNVPNALRKLRKLDLLKGANQYKCEKCKRLRDAKKELSVHEAPPILTLHIKRFNFRGKKINKRIQFSDSLDLNAAMDKDAPHTRYNLYAVVCHQGPSNTSGHYYSYIKTSDRQWYRADDCSIDRVDRGQVFRNDEAYIFFYSRDPEDFLDAAIHQDRRSATAHSESSLRKRKNSQAPLDSSQTALDGSEQQSNEGTNQLSKRPKLIDLPNFKKNAQPKIIGPMLPPARSEQPTNSNPQGTLENASPQHSNSMADITASTIEPTEDLGEIVPRPSTGSSGGGAKGNGQHQRNKPKHRVLINGNNHHRQTTHHRLNSVSNLQPKIIRG